MVFIEIVTFVTLNERKTADILLYMKKIFVFIFYVRSVQKE